MSLLQLPEGSKDHLIIQAINAGDLTLEEAEKGYLIFEVTSLGESCMQPRMNILGKFPDTDEGQSAFFSEVERYYREEDDKEIHLKVPKGKTLHHN